MFLWICPVCLAKSRMIQNNGLSVMLLLEEVTYLLNGNAIIQDIFITF